MPPLGSIFRTATFLLVALVHPALAGDIERDFADPPLRLRPYVWWHWMGSNISKEGITRDLEAMKASGVGGATIFNLASAVAEGAAPTAKCPWPDLTYRSPGRWEMVAFAATEARRLGLEIGMHNCVGYSATSGPWVTPEKSMQKLVWAETSAAGTASFAATLPAPKATLSEPSRAFPARHAMRARGTLAETFGMARRATPTLVGRRRRGELDRSTILKPAVNRSLTSAG